MNVLLVDDEPVLRKMVKLMLQSHGFRVFDAANKADAIALSQEHPINLLLTDVVMEDEDGFNLAHTLVERHPDLPVIFMSGYPANFEAEKQRFARCAFLGKPFLNSDLIFAIGELTSMTFGTASTTSGGE